MNHVSGSESKRAGLGLTAPMTPQAKAGISGAVATLGPPDKR